ncbi:MAG: T9SS type A sorting domain-containing protein [Lewinellaceae bacterium]|nr:T9SS type A sorting domain-containing protein [Lewinellaceae bacterium]
MRLIFLLAIFLLAAAPSFGQSLLQSGDPADLNTQTLRPENDYWLDADAVDIRTRPAAAANATARVIPIPPARPAGGKGRDPDPCTPTLYDGFESGSYSPTWVETGGSYTRSVDMVDPAVGNYSLTQTGSSSHYQGLQATFAPAQPAEMSWWVQPQSNAYCGYVVIGDENTPSNNGILFFYYHYPTSSLRFYANSSNVLDIPGSINNWYLIEIKDIDWTNKHFDIYINGGLIQSNFPFRSQASTSVSRAYLYNFSSGTAKYDDINIGCEVAVDPCANDTEAPSISCPGFVTPAVLDPNNCTNALPDYRPFVSVSDNCDENPALSQSPEPGTVITGVQTVTVTVTATDASGNSNSCTYTVPHVDVTPPTPVCRTTTVYLNPYGYYFLEEEDVLDYELSSDNCGEVYVTDIAPYYFDCSDVGNTYPVNVSVEDESENPASCTAMITVEKGTELPYPWDSEDIGNPGTGNNYAYDPCEYEFTINAGAANNMLGSDNMAFIEKDMCGDFEITVQVLSITPNGYAGLMARESDAAGSKMVGMYSNHSPMVRWEARTLTNGNKGANFFQKPAPYWLKLVRQGNWFFGYYSFNGVNFAIVTAQSVPMNDCLEIGMTAFSNIPGSTATAVFGNVDCGEEEGEGVIQLPTAELGHAGIGRNISLFPNPARDVVTVSFSGLPQQLPGGVTLRLRNELGQLLEQRQLDGPAERFEWNVNQLRPGLYFMEVQEEGQAPQVLRFVKAE